MLLQITLFCSFYYLYPIVYMYHIFFIHSSIDGYLGCFHVLAIANNATMNTEMHVSSQLTVFSGFMPRSEVVVLL